MDREYTPEFITSLGENEVFVFGSNLAGSHGGGAARVARQRFGAVMGQGVGMQGQSYAIPTMQGGVETIKPYVDDFVEYARRHGDKTFYVTRIGCGIAGFDDEEIAPLFVEALELENVRLPKSFVAVLTSGEFAGSYLSGWQKHYSSFDMAIDYMLILDRFQAYKPQDLEKALSDLERKVGVVSRSLSLAMTELLYVNYPKATEPGTAENVKSYLAAVEQGILRSDPYDIPYMRYIYSMTAGLANFMLEAKDWNASATDADKQGDMFFYILFSIMTGRWNCGDNRYIFDNMPAAWPVFKRALTANWQEIFTDQRIDRQKVVTVFSNPDIWLDWNEKAEHKLAVNCCALSVLRQISHSKGSKYISVGDCYIPMSDYSLPVFKVGIGRVHFPNFALKKAFIEGQISKESCR